MHSMAQRSQRLGTKSAPNSTSSAYLYACGRLFTSYPYSASARVDVCVVTADRWHRFVAADSKARNDAFMDDFAVRVVSWNLRSLGTAGARRQGELLRELRPDLILLQEVNLSSAEILQQAAGADWLICAADLRVRNADDRPVRNRGVAIAGRGLPPRRAWLPADVPLPERILLAEITVDGLGLIAVSYHAPPGVNWGIAKARQAVAFARWLSAQQGPILLGADANTPLIDAVDFAATRTHWHTGNRCLKGELGDDLLFGPGKIHPLDDGLRRWLADHPAEAAALAERPSGPLAVTHRTGQRRDSPGTGRRFDSIWVTAHWTVEHIDHLYDEGVAAGSDHAVIVADLAGV